MNGEMILIPILEDDLNLIRDYLQSEIRQDKDGARGAFYKVLDVDVSHIDRRAWVSDVRISYVNIKGDELYVEYQVHYEIYNGCKDLDVFEYESNEVVGERTLEGWEFAQHEPLPPRIPSDDI